MRYRTIREAAAYFAMKDIFTAITEYRIRQLVVSGAVPSIRAGKKYLVTLEALEDYSTLPSRQRKSRCLPPDRSGSFTKVLADG